MTHYIPTELSGTLEYSFGLRPLYEYVSIHAGRMPDKACLVYYGKRITYAQLEESINRLGNALRRLDAGPVVTLFMQNCPQFVFAHLAAQKAGLIPASLDPMFKTWEVENRLRMTGSRVVIANSCLYPVLEPLVEQGVLSHVILTDFSEYLPETPEIPLHFSFEAPESRGGALSLAELMREASPEPPPGRERDIAEPGLILFTSGTSGMPKATMLSLKSQVYKAARYGAAYHYTQQTRWLQTQGMYHIGGMLMLCVHLYNASTMVLLTRFNLDSVRHAIQRYLCDAWYASAQSFRQLLDDPDSADFCLCSLRQGTSSSFGISTTGELAERWAKATGGGLLIESGYGLTESHTAAAAMPPERPKHGTFGIPLFGHGSVKIIGPDGKECPPNVEGEIVVRDDGVFLGYMNNPEAMEEIFRDGWLYTGDVGFLDDEGYLTFLGRTKQMLKTSGFSVFPEEVETLLSWHEAVERVAVVGVPDPKRGERVKAFIQLTEEGRGRVTGEDLILWARERMASYKCPREIEFRDNLPISSTGKILRKALFDPT
ncbi:putative Acyl-CoA synthetase (AMP-forming)/AMP-acid ligase II [uncultured delta proteobacterium]|uniref:Putative Acyl-CoA synthetase (AMP-forming)/AMP-acid ligase II n=1 Tax=uncultured delta proteobacterium TaxID=34034 RepID=A0A212KA22_9DELT|nr:putative Acyl-CoA synthetase (AMP-forming)/AMP-acid ligase II [uncultured delta proteobacterium]